jgi:endonuclease YncB( thermonuclease family)
MAAVKPCACRMGAVLLLLAVGANAAAKPEKPVIEGKARVVDGDTLWIGELPAQQMERVIGSSSVATSARSLLKVRSMRTAQNNHTCSCHSSSTTLSVFCCTSALYVPPHTGNSRIRLYRIDAPSSRQNRPLTLPHLSIPPCHTLGLHTNPHRRQQDPALWH